MIVHALETHNWKNLHVGLENKLEWRCVYTLAIKKIYSYSFWLKSLERTRQAPHVLKIMPHHQRHRHHRHSATITHEASIIIINIIIIIIIIIINNINISIITFVSSFPKFRSFPFGIFHLSSPGDSTSTRQPNSRRNTGTTSHEHPQEVGNPEGKEENKSSTWIIKIGGYEAHQWSFNPWS